MNDFNAKIDADLEELRLHMKCVTIIQKSCDFDLDVVDIGRVTLVMKLYSTKMLSSDEVLSVIEQLKQGEMVLFNTSYEHACIMARILERCGLYINVSSG